MIESVKMNHPYRKDGKPFTCGDVLCNTTPGNHRLISSTEKGDFDIFGVGIVLYFKFMKMMICLFFLFSILSVPAYLFFISGYIYNTGSTSTMTYSDGLTATTLAGVGYSTSVCTQKNYSQSATSVIYLNCSVGTLADFSYVNYGLISTSTSCALANSVSNEILL